LWHGGECQALSERDSKGNSPHSAEWGEFPGPRGENCVGNFRALGSIPPGECAEKDIPDQIPSFFRATIPSMTLRRVVLFVAILLLFSGPAMAAAQTGWPGKIVPCDGVGANPCNICHLGTLAQNILTVGIYVAVFLSAILFAYAGFLYLTNEALNKQQQAKDIFKNVVLGLIVVLSAWLIVDTTMRVLTGSGASIGAWNQIC